ncbi:MAG: glycosyltransferase, partial [Verrucomicrobiota bacterium]
CWGADVLGGTDHAGVRVGYLHNIFPQFERYVRYYGQFLDGFLSVSAPMHAAVCRVVTAEQSARSHWLPVPVEPQFQPPLIPPARCVIGLCGRIIREQKRVDRLPELLARLDAAGLDYQVELLGDGPDRAWLAERIGPHPRVVFHGWCEDARTAAVMQGWKYFVSLSDYEGQSIALLEAMAAGCLPLYPDFHAGAELPPRTARACLYPPGDMATLVERLCALERASGTEIAILRAELAGESRLHTNAGYLGAFTAWAEALLPANQRRAATPWRRLAAPVWAYNRFYKRLTHAVAA